MRASLQNFQLCCSFPRSFWRSVVLAFLAASLIACATRQSTQPGMVGIERKQTLWVSSGEVEQASAKAYLDLLHQAERQGALNQNAQEVARVRTVAQRLISAAALFRTDAPGWNWEVNVIGSKEVNAWCMPGGKVAVYSGLMESLQLSGNELAAVMGHEIAHALREHGRERASRALAANLGLAVVGAAVGADKAQMDLAGLIADLTIHLPNSREFETEADRIGVELAARAGYDPRAALTLWDKMQRGEGTSLPQWLFTHPTHENRRRDLVDYSQRVLPLYEEAVRGR